MVKRLFIFLIFMIFLFIIPISVPLSQGFDIPIPCELEYLICKAHYPDLWWLCELQYLWCQLYQM